MPRDFYAYGFRSGGLDKYLIWYSNDSDGVQLESGGHVPTFDSIDELIVYAESHKLAPLTTGDSVMHDLDRVDCLIKDTSQIEVDCHVVLSAWNLFGDLARSIGPSGKVFLDRDRSENVVYDKVFFGCNLPAMTPEGHEYVPIWTSGELVSIRELLGIGLALFRSSIRPTPTGNEEANPVTVECGENCGTFPKPDRQ